MPLMLKRIEGLLQSKPLVSRWTTTLFFPVPADEKHCLHKMLSPPGFTVRLVFLESIALFDSYHMLSTLCQDDTFLVVPKIIFSYMFVVSETNTTPSVFSFSNGFLLASLDLWIFHRYLIWPLAWFSDLVFELFPGLPTWSWFFYLGMLFNLNEIWGFPGTALRSCATVN